MRSTRARALLAFAFVFALGSSLSGCAGSAPPPPDVAVEIIQQRDDLDRQLQLRVVNGGEEPITVTRAVLTSTRIRDSAIWEGESRVPSGSARALPVTMPESECPADDYEDEVEITIVAPDGTTTFSLTPQDPIKSLAGFTAQDCLEQAVAERASIDPAAALRSETRGSQLFGLLELTLSPTADAEGTVLIEGVRGTTLLKPPNGVDWPLGIEISPGTATQTIVLEFTPARCDPHAVAEDKRGTLLPVSVFVDGLEGTVYVPLSDAVRGEVHTYMARACGWV